jgi:OPA family glycerol-3-phosphate transporter-like MFS transporter
MLPAAAEPVARDADDAAHRARALRRQQIGIVALLFAGYAACYFCRADLSVATPLLIEEFGRQGVSHDDAQTFIGTVTSLGVLAYAFGKFFLTGLGDFWGGRRNFLIGMGGAVVFTLLFAVGGGFPVFTLAWVGNRLTQSIGWAGLIKVSSRWFDYSVYGTVIGILSISYLIGDAAARQSMGVLIAHGFGWRALFVYAAVVVGIAFIANALFLRESRTELGHAEARVNPLSLYAGSASKAGSVAQLLAPLFRSPAFLLVCFLSFGCTIVRETFNTWNPQYLRDQLGFSVSDSASLSAIFPGVGAVSVLLSGWLSDRLGLSGRSLLMIVGLTASAVVLLMLAAYSSSAHRLLAVAGIGVVAFALLGPYSYLGGAFALDFGGKQASAVASGLIDGVGYLGGTLAGYVVAKVSVVYGWKGVFGALAVISLLAAFAAGYLLIVSRRAATAVAADE